MWISEQTILGDLLDADEGAEEILLSFGMTCVGCPAARAETIEEACEVHDVDVRELLIRLRSRDEK